MFNEPPSAQLNKLFQSQYLGIITLHITPSHHFDTHSFYFDKVSHYFDIVGPYFEKVSFF